MFQVEILNLSSSLKSRARVIGEPFKKTQSSIALFWSHRYQILPSSAPVATLQILHLYYSFRDYGYYFLHDSLHDYHSW